MIERLAGLLRRAMVETDEIALADALWLARFLPYRHEASAADSKPPPRPPAQSAAPSQLPEPASHSTAEKLSRSRKWTTVVDRPSAPLYVRSSAGAAARAREINVTGAPALPGALAIGRAFRPLGRRFRSRLTQEFDEAATVQRSADAGFVDLVYRPTWERWFTLTLIVEDTPSMSVWAQTATELERLLAPHGAFADVRRWSMRADGTRIVLRDSAGNVRHRDELRDPGARRLVIFASDCVSDAWHRGLIPALLRDWARTTPVAVLQMLPTSLWRHTAIGAPAAQLSSLVPGRPNTGLSISPSDPDERFTRRDTPLPVVCLDADALNQWARMIMGAEASVPGMIIPATPDADDDWQADTAAVTRLDADSRVRRFHALVSEDAYRLATYLSAVPLSLSVMRLVHSVIIAAPQQWQLAEVILGGIMRHDTDAAGAEDPRFEFFPGVREVLQLSIRHDDLLRLLDRLSEYLADRLGRGVDFSAFVFDPEGDQEIPADARPFALLGAAALRRFEMPTGRSSAHGDSPAGKRTVREEEVFAPGLTIARTLRVPDAAIQIAWSPDGRFLAVLTDRTITTFAAESGETVPEFTAALPEAGSDPLVLASYAEKDTTFARSMLKKLQDELEAVRGDSVRIATLDEFWFADGALGSQERAVEAIQSAAVFIAFITPQYLESPWSQEEFRTASMLLSDAGNTIAVTLKDVTPRGTAYTINVREPAESGSIGIAQEALGRLVRGLLRNRHGERAVSEEVPITLDGTFVFRQVAWSPGSDELAVCAYSASRSVSALEFLGKDLRFARSWNARPRGARATVVFERGATLDRIDEIAWRRFTVTDRPVDEIAFSDSRGRIVLWAEGQLFPSSPTDPSPPDDLNGGPHIGWSPDYLTLGAADRTGVVKLLVGGRDFERVRGVGLQHPERYELFERDMPLWSPFVWSPDGRWFATWGDRSTSVAIWNASTRQLVHNLETHGVVREITFSADSQFLAVETGTRALWLWRTDTWELATRTEHEISADKRRPLAFAPRAETLAVVEGNTVNLLRLDRSLLDIRQALDYALVCGCDRYPTLLSGDSDTAEEAARRFAHWLTEFGGVPADHVVMKIGQEATANAVAAAYVDLAQKIGTPPATAASDDPWKAIRSARRLYLYFSGMGASVPAHREPEWLPADFEIVSSATQTAILTFRGLPRLADQLVTIVDSGTTQFAPKSVLPGFVSEFLARATAERDANVDVFKPISNPTPVGVLTDCVLRALTETGADSTGRVTVDSFARALTEDWHRRRLSAPAPSRTELDFSTTSNFVLTQVRPSRLTINADPIYEGLTIEIRPPGRASSILGVVPADGRLEFELAVGSYVVVIPEIDIRRSVALDSRHLELNLPWTLRNTRVCVVGSTVTPISDDGARMAAALGRLLAQGGLRLVSTGSVGVDELTVRSYLECTRLARGRRVPPVILVRQWTSPSLAQYLRSGEVTWIDQFEGERNFQLLKDNMEVLIAIGDVPRAREIENFFSTLGFLVIPIPSAEKAGGVFDAIERSTAPPWLKGLRQTLSAPRESDADSRRVAAEIVRNLRALGSTPADLPAQ